MKVKLTLKKLSTEFKVTPDRVYVNKEREILFKFLYRNLIKSMRLSYKFDIEVRKYVEECIKFTIFSNKNEIHIEKLIFSYEKLSFLNEILINQSELRKTILRLSIFLCYGQRIDLLSSEEEKFLINKLDLERFTFTNKVFTFCSNYFLNDYLLYTCQSKIAVDSFLNHTPIPEYLYLHVVNTVIPLLQESNDENENDEYKEILDIYKRLI